MNDFSAENAAVLPMRMEREMISLPKSEYLQMAKGLPELAAKKWVLRFEKKYVGELTTTGTQEVKVLALRLEMEDEQLNEWRQAVDKIRARNTKARSG